MNLANIFGLHIGCMVENGGIGTLTSVDSDGSHIAVDHVMENIEGWKLILKPLSAITEEHKREFEDKFLKKEFTLDSFTVYSHSIDKLAYDRFGDRSCEATDTLQDIWLALKGYDVGIVPDKYKIVEG